MNAFRSLKMTTPRGGRLGEQLCLAAVIFLIALPSGWAADELPSIAPPIAHWQFDDDGREARDSVGTHHGRIVGAVSQEGKAGRALRFDRAKEDYVGIPYSPDFEIGTFTVSAWVWLTKEPTFSGILGTRAG